MKKKLISLEISTGKYFSFIEKMISLSRKGNSSYVCVANVHMLVEAFKDKQFSKVVNGADIVTPDGMPLAKGIQLIYGTKQDRVAGMDLLPDLLKRSESDGISVFFYGGTQEMLDRTEVYCNDNFPDLNLSGLYSPPFRPLSHNEEEEIIDMINSSGAQFVFVALGCPKQERWMASMKGRINACMIGIGGALPVMVGLQKRAPVWMQHLSLEWLYRLSQEPRRLFKRYFVTNTLFMCLFAQEYISSKFRRA